MDTVNLLVPSYNLFRYNLEKIENETGKNIRLAGIPWHYNDTTMRVFFSTAYPSEFSMDDGTFYDDGFHYFSREHEALLHSSGEKLFPAKQVSYKDAIFLGRRRGNFPDEKSMEIELNEMIDLVHEWFDPNSKTIIDLSGLQHEDAEKDNALFLKQKQLLALARMIATDFDSKIFFFDSFTQIPSMKRMFSWTETELKMPKPVDICKKELDSSMTRQLPPEFIKECDKLHEEALFNYLEKLIK